MTFTDDDTANAEDRMRQAAQADNEQQLKAERDAWKTLHDAKGNNIPYGYASQEQRHKIHDALAVLGIEKRHNKYDHECIGGVPGDRYPF